MSTKCFFLDLKANILKRHECYVKIQNFPENMSGTDIARLFSTFGRIIDLDMVYKSNSNCEKDIGKSPLKRIYYCDVYSILALR